MPANTPNVNPDPQAALTAARNDLAAYVQDTLASGSAETDPYTFAVTTVQVVLEYALDDGISPAMSYGQFRTLDHLAQELARLDHNHAPEPRVG
jgi:hypothetical protein